MNTTQMYIVLDAEGCDAIGEPRFLPDALVYCQENEGCTYVETQTGFTPIREWALSYYKGSGAEKINPDAIFEGLDQVNDLVAYLGTNDAELISFILMDGLFYFLN
jgi:hypothetical protein